MYMWDMFMKQALEQGSIAVSEGDAPFGCVVLDNRLEVVWRDHDRVKSTCDPTAHAEINAIRELCKAQRRTKLDGYIFVTTSEPCPTCLSALVRVRAKLCVFGAPIECDASLPIAAKELAARAHHHNISLVGGVLEDQCKRERREGLLILAGKDAA
tara:strand:- start:21701 stop:22168 length:468 start_codon:yes stop_codon:yes gene_type:complete